MPVPEPVSCGLSPFGSGASGSAVVDVPPRPYLRPQVWDSLTADRRPHRTLVKTAGYVLGEFGHTIAEQPGSSAADQLRVLHEHFLQAEPDVRALLLNTFSKLSHAYGEVAAQVGEVLRTSATAMDQEVQQRSIEYLALGDNSMSEVKNQVLERRPHPTPPPHPPSVLAYAPVHHPHGHRHPNPQSSPTPGPRDDAA